MSWRLLSVTPVTYERSIALNLSFRSTCSGARKRNGRQRFNYRTDQRLLEDLRTYIEAHESAA